MHHERMLSGLARNRRMIFPATVADQRLPERETRSQRLLQALTGRRGGFSVRNERFRPSCHRGGSLLLVPLPPDAGLRNERL